VTLPAEHARILAEADKRKEFVTGEDGYVVYWPAKLGGAYSSWVMRLIADELDRRNADWDRQMQETFGCAS